MKIDGARMYELVVLTLVGFGQLYIMSQQLEVMDNQRKISDEQNRIIRAQQRPWLSATEFEIKDDIIHDNNGVLITIRAKLKNSGQAVAQHAFFAFTPYLFSYPAHEKPVACQNAETSQNYISIFPGDTGEIGTTALINEADIARMVSGFSDSKSITGGIVTTIMLCVAYQSPTGGEFHRTQYMLTLENRDQKQPRSLLPEFEKNTRVIPATSVSLRMLPIGRFNSAY